MSVRQTPKSIFWIQLYSQTDIVCFKVIAYTKILDKHLIACYWCQCTPLFDRNKYIAIRSTCIRLWLDPLHVIRQPTRASWCRWHPFILATCTIDHITGRIVTLKHSRRSVTRRTWGQAGGTNHGCAALCHLNMPVTESQLAENSGCMCDATR